MRSGDYWEQAPPAVRVSASRRKPVATSSPLPDIALDSIFRHSRSLGGVGTVASPAPARRPSSLAPEESRAKPVRAR